jgi:hypothetical protein
LWAWSTSLEAKEKNRSSENREHNKTESVVSNMEERQNYNIAMAGCILFMSKTPLNAHTHQ